MIIKEIKYTDYNDEERIEDFHFNLSKAELAEWESSHNGGLSTMIQRVTKEQNMKEIMELFKDLIDRSIGEKSDDGKYFTKSPEITARFRSTEAYSELYMELASDAQAALDFVNGVVPKGLSKEAKLEALSPLT